MSVHRLTDGHEPGSANGARARSAGAPRSLYIAGASSEIERAERWIAAARESRVPVTYDWPAEVRAAGGANKGSPEELRAAAIDCWAGAMSADVCLVLAPQLPHTTTGAWAELAIAFGTPGTSVLVSSPHGSQFCLFAHLPGVKRFESDEDAFACVVALCHAGEPAEAVGT